MGGIVMRREHTARQAGSDRKSFEPMLAEMSNDGWELVSVITFAEPRFIPGTWYTYFFKRRKGGTSPDDIQAAKECLRDAGIIDMTRVTP